ncbi:hypothetical protein HYH02_008278 [Chlamydomonas schloesseri]|uniref:RNA-polymerase II-associated protein 3-like C-terminal domain-containing protein n=1 Tax=Chlamydomonas schloesseri TaxID=2026947 RepID=A0A835WFW5_9CHLO|nr:hypothetical protein HYH02_008278 [Chlamydomonas schloesseri]|eukprot:KAG2446713.1 hypothetical protein HYH02_008278 [Chlamydomonas schloesseri]
MDVQFQIRQNAMEMQEYMKDLFDWQQSMKKKEKKARSEDQGGVGGGLPAPRGRAGGAVAPAPSDLMRPALGPGAAAGAAPRAATEATTTSSSTVTASPAPKNAAAHTYTAYSKWDKFNVDAALASDDEEDGAGAAAQPKPRPAGPSGAVASEAASSSAPVTAAAAALAPAPASAAAPAAAVPAPAPAAPALASKPDGIAFKESAGEDLLRPVTTTRIAPAASTSTSAPSTSAPSTSTSAAAAAEEPVLPPIRNTQPTTADAWRARGNDLFKAGEYDSAYECYSRSVELQPTCLGHANRAMALLKMKRWKEAVDDCDAALALDPLYVKAYQRRAAAHRALGAGLQAAADWESALRLEPDNRATAADRDASLEALMAAEKLAPPSRRVAVPVTAQVEQAVAGKMGQAVAAGMKKLAVEEVSEEKEQAAGSPQAAAASSSSERAEQTQQQQQLSSAASPESAPGTRSSNDGPSASAAPASAAAPNPAPAAPAAPAASTSKTATAATSASSSAPASAGSAPTTTITATTTTTTSTPAAPRTSVEFESAWRSMAGDGARQAAYLAAIPPASLPAVFKNSLTAPVLSGMLRCLLTAQVAAAAAGATAAAAVKQPGTAAVDGETAVAVLEGLTRVARFDLMAMSVPSKERAELKAAWGEAEAALRGAGREAAAAGLAALRSKYRCA